MDRAIKEWISGAELMADSLSDSLTGLEATLDSAQLFAQSARINKALRAVKQAVGLIVEAGELDEPAYK